MWRYLLFATVYGANVKYVITAPGENDQVPVFQMTPLLIVLEAMLEEMYVDRNILIERVLENDQLALSPEEAAEAVASAKRAVLRPIAHPEWFHQALASFEGDINPKSAKFREYFWRHIPTDEGKEFLDETAFYSLITTWYKYCIHPSRQGVIRCRRIQRTRIDGVREKHWVLTEDAIKQYMGDLLWRLRLEALS